MNLNSRNGVHDFRPEQRQPFPVLNCSSFFPTSAARETPCFPGGFLTYYPKLSFAFSAKRSHNRHASCRRTARYGNF